MRSKGPSSGCLWKRLLACFVLLCGFWAVTACSPVRTVYIPPEWRTPIPPPSASSRPSERPAKPSEETPSAAQGPILKSQPSFKESDLPSSSVPPPPAPAAPPLEAPPPAATAQPAAKAPVKKPAAQQPPQRLASMHLVNQAKTSLAQGKADAAISLLEQAIQVDVSNGEAFYGLARAWRMKGARQKALEFSRKAEILFQNDPGKLKEVYLFEADIAKELGERAKADLYRQKAQRLGHGK